jgi:hypothetical protein
LDEPGDRDAPAGWSIVPVPRYRFFGSTVGGETDDACGALTVIARRS